MLLPDLNVQKELTNLALGDVVWQHQMGNDREAVERARDLLAMSRAVDELPTIVSHMVSTGIVAATMHKLSLMSPSLRVGGSEGALRREDVRKLIDELLDENATTAGLRRAARWERASNLDALRSL